MVDQKQSFSNFRTISFVIIICTVCALTLSILAEFLKKPQQNAKELYRSKQLLLAANILDYSGHFVLDGKIATYNGYLTPYIGSSPPLAKTSEILEVFEQRIEARLVDDAGNLITFKEAGIRLEDYLRDHSKLGFSHLPLKLIYVVKSNTPSKSPYGYVILVNGYGLWDAIYGYLGVSHNGDTVLGMTWYDQKETPGLGGEISLPDWQKQFFGKVIFQKALSGQTNFERAPLGIKVVKTNVKETYGNSPLANSAVDGIAGASITVSSVNEALRASLNPYRPFLIKAHQNEVTIDD